MSGSPRELAALWMERGRPEKAEPELRRALALDPEDTETKIDLARCLYLLDREKEALPIAKEAVGEAPDWTYSHFVLSLVYSGLDKDKLAEKAAREGLLLDPEADYLYGALASALLGQKRWKDALEAAETGLAIDPEEAQCLGARGVALTNLGQTADAASGLEASLLHDPENPQTHFLLGYAALNEGRHDAAVQHFSESLRLAPESEGARAGLVNALKAKQGFYRPFLAWFLFLGKLPTGKVYAIFIATILLRRYLKTLSETYPDYAPAFIFLGGLMVVFILMTWIAEPLFDLVLRLSPHGRFALKEREVFNSNCLGLVLLASVLCLALGFAGVPTMYLIGALVGSWAIPMVRALRAETAKAKGLHRGLAVLLLLLGVVGAGHQNVVDRWRAGMSTEALQLIRIPGSLREEYILELPEQRRSVLLAELPAVLAEIEPKNAQLEIADKCMGAYLLGFVIQTWIP